MELVLDHVQITGPAECETNAREFYGGLLGLKELERPVALHNQGGLWFSCGDLQVHIGIDPDFRPARKAHAAFRVRDFTEFRERLQEAGCEIVDDTVLPGVQRFFSFDPWRLTSYSKWDCKYHALFVPRTRRKVIFGQVRRELGKVFHALAKQIAVASAARNETSLASIFGLVDTRYRRWGSNWSRSSNTSATKWRRIVTARF